LDNLLRVKNKEKELIILVKVLYSVVYGKMIKKYKVNLFYLMAIFLKEYLNSTKDIQVFINIEMEMYMKGHGKMMLNKA
jgi:hypothetical protein